MFPAVPLPNGSKVRVPVDATLKTGWDFDASRRAFRSRGGKSFSPYRDLPKGSRIVYKVPHLAKADVGELSEPEQELRRFLQVILPADAAPKDYLKVVRSWPAIADASLGPQVSLPTSTI